MSASNLAWNAARRVSNRAWFSRRNAMVFSTSLSARLLARIDTLTHQTVRTRRGHAHLEILAHPSGLAWKIHHPVAGSPAHGLTEPRLVALHQDFELAADQRLVAPQLNLPLAFLNLAQAPAFLFVRDVVRPAAGGGLRARRVFEGKHLVVADAVDERESLLEIGLGLAAETHDHVR